MRHFKRPDHLVAMADYYCALPIVSIFPDAGRPSWAKLIETLKADDDFGVAVKEGHEV